MKPFSLFIKPYGFMRKRATQPFPATVLSFVLIGLIPLILSARSPERGAQEPPNVVLIMTDDQGWGDVRSHGNPKIDTPAMDQLAQEGVQFERFFVSPVCAPTRR